jgi:hypothetical protein
VRPHLHAWYRADSLALEDGAAVSRWPDDSGHERHLAPTSVESGVGVAPRFVLESRLGQRPAVRFGDASGLASSAQRPLPLQGDAAYTIFLAVGLQPPGSQFASSVVIGFGEPAAASNPGRPWAGLCEILRPTAQLAHSGGFGHNATLPPGSATALFDGPWLITIVKRPGPMSRGTEIYLNGIAAGEHFGGAAVSGSDAVPELRQRQDYAVMMGRAIAALGGFRGDVAEAAIYDQALDRDARQGIEKDFLVRYGLAAGGTVIAAAGRHPIDAFVEEVLAAKSLAAAPRADRRTLIRRAFFDLVGLPPPPERVEAFVADASPRAWENLIDELLASPQYGERWGRHWLDVARYADTGGYETDIYFKNAWRYRDYVVAAFNDDKPYDRFVSEQIAGDEIWPDNLDLHGSYEIPPEKLDHLAAHVATGFYALGPQIHESNMDAKKLSLERLTDWVDTTGAAFLGVTMACARCHDHKFDPLTQRDYYGLQAAFAASKEVEIPLINGMEIADYKQHYPKLLALDEARKAYRLFEQSVAGRVLSEEENQRRQQRRDALVEAALAVPERATSSPNSPFVGLMEIPTATVLGPEREALIPPVHVLSRGELTRPTERVTPSVPAVLARSTAVPTALPGPINSRKELALWLTRADHPLTARVMVNRLWQWHFGRGIVATPNDFGKMGVPPSHPALLDWLASEFVARSWSVKAMHRLVMTSETYQRSSQFSTPDHVRADAENRLLWRGARRRLEGETLWDAVHAVSGTLNLRMGGRPVMPPLAAEELTDKAHWVVSADPSEHTRRGLYILVRRNFRFPMFEVYDAPVNAVSCAAREVSTVAPQALWMLNSQTAFGQSQQLAARVLREAGPAPEAWIDRAWHLALSRLPTAQERGEALELLGQLEQSAADRPPLRDLPRELAALPAPRAAALCKLCLAVLNLNEFVYVD